VRTITGRSSTDNPSTEDRGRDEHRDREHGFDPVGDVPERGGAAVRVPDEGRERAEPFAGLDLVVAVQVLLDDLFAALELPTRHDVRPHPGDPDVDDRGDDDGPQGGDGQLPRARVDVQRPDLVGVTTLALRDRGRERHDEDERRGLEVSRRDGEEAELQDVAALITEVVERIQPPNRHIVREW
jgi:hypothetical protein